ncbi:hypothetical protein DPMN_086677 [Dreissena polymorpha]|uniref:Uncharacterized protein n=1 Tax=Dreissena polymorpha TaxID=45954 RepID=A0A9D4KRM1_DREPO|nr:hypothetical protein DPMN_086677 [Dreissena polymorpha]
MFNLVLNQNHDNQVDILLSFFIYDMRHGKMVVMSYRASVASDQHGHLHSLVRSYHVGYKVTRGFGFSSADRVAPGHTS